MGETTGIQWCHHTLNPWIGCAKISDACKHCYAEVSTFARASRSRGLELWGVNAARHETSAANWRQARKWNAAAATAGERRRVFCASLADVFEDRRDLDEKRERLFKLVEECAALDWMLLTKRADRILDLCPPAWRDAWPAHAWIGATVEDQEQAELRIPALAKVPATIRFLSCEPLFEPLDLGAHLGSISLLIIGGESGSKARPFDLEWARSLIRQARAADTRPFFKQAGSHAIENGTRLRLADSHGGELDELPKDLWVREMPGATR